MKNLAVARVVVVGGSYAGVELSCNLAAELGGNGAGRVEVTLTTNSEVRKPCRGRREGRSNAGTDAEAVPFAVDSFIVLHVLVAAYNSRVYPGAVSRRKVSCRIGF